MIWFWVMGMGYSEGEDVGVGGCWEDYAVEIHIVYNTHKALVIPQRI